MFYKIVTHHIPKLYNMSKVKRVELVHNTIYLYYNYTNVGGNMFFFWSHLREDCDTIKCNNQEEAKYHFESMEKLLK